MADHDQEHKVEELLDSMLAAYSAVAPRPGLETRVLANLKAAREKQRPWFGLQWMWAGAAAAVIAGIALIFLLRSGERQQTPAIETVRTTQQPAPKIAREQGTDRPPASTATVHPVRKEGTQQIADTRPDVFPTPAPLSDQEKLMLRYLAGTPREEIVAQSHADEPPQDTLPQDQTALPGSAVNSSQFSNTR
jgi:cytoskeletal protein RodZ